MQAAPAWVDHCRVDVETLVTVDFKAISDATEVVITHELFPVEDTVTGHNEGWASGLNRLEALFS